MTTKPKTISDCIREAIERNKDILDAWRASVTAQHKKEQRSARREKRQRRKARQ